MPTIELLAIAVTLFITVSLVSGNNLPACVGTLIGSGVVRKRTGILIGIAGYITGLLLQGSAMVRVSSLLFPSASPLLVAEALAVTIVVFISGIYLRVPLSLTMSLVGLIAGISVSRHLPIDTAYASTVIGTWFAAPLIAIATSVLSIRLLGKSRPGDIWRRASTYKLMLLLSSFLAAYVLGANTMGVIVAVAGFSTQNIVVAVLAVPVGSFFLSSGGLQRIGRDIFSLRYSNALVTLLDSVILVETATFFGLPLSNTQTLSAALFGAGISYKERFLSAKPFILIVIGWILAALTSFTIGLII